MKTIILFIGLALLSYNAGAQGAVNKSRLSTIEDLYKPVGYNELTRIGEVQVDMLKDE